MAGRGPAIAFKFVVSFWDNPGPKDVIFFVSFVKRKDEILFCD